MRYEGNKVVITESELRWLVNETANNILKENGEDEGRWGGIKNAFKGMGNGNFNLKQTYNAGRDASAFAKYAQQANTAIQGMQNIANNNGSPNVSNSLDSVARNINSVSQQYERQAQNVANGSARQLRKVKNPWGNTVNGPQQKTGKTIQMTPKVTNAQAAAGVDNSGFASKLGQGIGKAGATIRNFGKGIIDGYNQNKITKSSQSTQPEVPQYSDRITLGGQSDNSSQMGNTSTNSPVQASMTNGQKLADGTQIYQRGNKYFKYDPRTKKTEMINQEDYNNYLNYSNTLNGLSGPSVTDSKTSRKVMPESKTVRITQNYIRDLVTETLNILMNEEGEAGGGGATNAAGVKK